jgi:hypothetical protein
MALEFGVQRLPFVDKAVAGHCNYQSLLKKLGILACYDRTSKGLLWRIG